MSTKGSSLDSASLSARVGVQLIWRPVLTVALMVKNPPANAGDVRDMGSNPGSGRSSGGGHGNPLQYSYLENPTDRGAWQATVHVVAESWIQLSVHMQPNSSLNLHRLSAL